MINVMALKILASMKCIYTHPASLIMNVLYICISMLAPVLVQRIDWQHDGPRPLNLTQRNVHSLKSTHETKASGNKRLDMSMCF